VTIAPGGTLSSGVAPPTSTLNFPAGDIRANGVTVGLGNDSLDAVYWSSTGKTADIIFDVTGYYTSGLGGATYHPRTTPAHARVLDSRSAIGVAGPFQARQPDSFQVTQYPGDPYSYGDLPSSAVAVTGNLTVVNQMCRGYLTIAPGDTLTPEVPPETSTINFPVGDTRANGVTAGLSPSGRLDLVYWWKAPENPALGTDPCAGK
jgi:hypothetical protein